MALRWVLAEGERAEEGAALDYISTNGGQVPGNFQSEVAHGLLQAERHNRISARDVTVSLSEIAALPLAVQLPDVHVVIATAREYGLSGYDGAYLALALQSNLPLATVDERLRKAARSAGVLWRYKN